MLVKISIIWANPWWIKQKLACIWQLRALCPSFSIQSATGDINQCFLAACTGARWEHFTFQDGFPVEQNLHFMLGQIGKYLARKPLRGQFPVLQMPWTGSPPEREILIAGDSQLSSSSKGLIHGVLAISCWSCPQAVKNKAFSHRGIRKRGLLLNGKSKMIPLVSLQWGILIKSSGASDLTTRYLRCLLLPLENP